MYSVFLAIHRAISSFRCWSIQTATWFVWLYSPLRMIYNREIRCMSTWHCSALPILAVAIWPNRFPMKFPSCWFRGECFKKSSKTYFGLLILINKRAILYCKFIKKPKYEDLLQKYQTICRFVTFFFLSKVIPWMWSSNRQLFACCAYFAPVPTSYPAENGPHALFICWMISTWVW